QHTGCISDIILTTPETNNNYIYQAGSTITTQNNYSINNQNISMKAGDAIVLFPNTEIRNNSLFLAKIENCPLSKPLESYHNTPINLSYNLEQSELKVQKVLVYPNPATSFFIIETEKLEKWEMYDLNGRLIQKGNESTNYINNLSDATYLLRIYLSDGSSETHKLIIK